MLGLLTGELPPPVFRSSAPRHDPAATLIQQHNGPRKAPFLGLCGLSPCCTPLPAMLQAPRGFRGPCSGRSAC